MNIQFSTQNTDVLITGRWWKVEGARWKRGLKPRSKPYGEGDAAE